MKEKVRAFFQNEKLKGLSKRIFNKRTIIGALIIIVLVIALRVTYSFMFEVKGVVSKVDGSKVTVVNFLTTKTVDIGSFQTTSSNIQVGDRIEIRKNLAGDIMSVRDDSSRNINSNGASFNGSRNNFKGSGGRNSMRGR